ncbi:hypothetical protein AcV5_004297 [Taiwanofungus camphoratus]|nr:hypothetical protein AcV5_004297 [Antrodia cinnamomea]
MKIRSSNLESAFFCLVKRSFKFYLRSWNGLLTWSTPLRCPFLTLIFSRRLQCHVTMLEVGGAALHDLSVCWLQMHHARRGSFPVMVVRVPAFKTWSQLPPSEAIPMLRRASAWRKCIYMAVKRTSSMVSVKGTLPLFQIHQILSFEKPVYLKALVMNRTHRLFISQSGSNVASPVLALHFLHWGGQMELQALYYPVRSIHKMRTIGF